MIVDKKKSYSLQNCSIDWSTVHQSIARYQLLTNDLIFIGSISHMILTSQCRGVVHILELDGRGYWKHFMDLLFTQWKDWIRKFWKKMKMYNKTVKDWLFQQQHFNPQPTTTGNRFVLGSNKTAVVLEPSQYCIL